MGLLEGIIAQQIYNGFKGLLLKGELVRRVPSGTLDANGDPICSTEQTYSMEGFVDNYSDDFRARAEIPETDVKVCIFAKSMPVEPTKDDIAIFRGIRYQLRRVNTDPAKALWECQAYEIR